MTRNSKRRAAEQAVIDAAIANANRLKSAYNRETLLRRERELITAVEALEALDLELPGDARSSTRHPVTSDQAAAWMRGARAKSAAARIVRWLYQRHYGGSTVDELIRDLSMPHQTCSPRVNELRNDGWIVDSGEKRLTRAKQEAIVWKLSTRARTLLAAEGVPYD